MKFSVGFGLPVFLALAFCSIGASAGKRKPNRNRNKLLPTSFPLIPDDGIPCAVRNRCEGRPPEGLSFHHSNCFCDEICTVYDDCCRDYKPDKDKPIPRWPHNNKKMLSCTRNTEIERDVEIYMIEQCPETYHDLEIREKCEDLMTSFTFLRLPVRGKQSGLLYRNYFCAICANETNVSFWRARLNCTNNPLKTVRGAAENPVLAADDVLKRQNHQKYLCELDFFHPSTPARKCRSAISGCQRGPYEIEEAGKKDKKCKSYTAMVYSGLSVFKNKHCARCQNVNESLITCIDQRTPRPRPVSTDDVFPAYMPPPFSIVLDLNSGNSTMYVNGPGGEKAKVTVAMYDCGPEKVYDPFIEKCRRVVCEPGYDLLQETCVLSSVNPSLTRTVPMSETSLSPYLPGHVEDEDSVTSRRTKKPRRTTPSTTTTSSFSHPVQWSVTPSFFEPNQGSDQSDTLYPIPEYFMAPGCRPLQLNGSDFQILPNRSLLVHSTKTLHLEFQYFKDDYSTFIRTCVTNNNNNSSDHVTTSVNETNKVMMFQFTSLQNLISFVGIIVSASAMFIMFVVFMFLPPLRNIPGKCLISLVFALFTAQILFLVGVPRTEIHSVCMALAAGMHYMILASFFWTNVMAIDIYRTFSAECHQHPDDSQSKRFCCYSFYAWLLPALIVGGALGMEFLDTDFGYDLLTPWRPHYGDGYCWIANKNALLYLFALPLALILVINIMLYIITIKNIHVVDHQAKMIQKEKEKNRLILCVKLALIMGCTWIFALLATLTDLHVLWYVFIAFNTLQGLFVCFAFVCTKKVFKLMRSRGRVHRAASYSRNVYTNGGSRPCARPTYMFHDGDIYKEIISQETSI